MTGTISKLLVTIVGALFGWVFKLNKELVRDARGDIYTAVKGLSKMSGAQLRAFLAAVPIFVSFMIVLLQNRDKFDSQKELMIVGAAAVLTTICSWMAVVVLTTTAFQLSLVVTMPAVGIPLLLSTTAFVFAVVVFLVWVVVFALNTVFYNNKDFIYIKQKFLGKEHQSLMDEVSDAVVGIEVEDNEEIRKTKFEKFNPISELVSRSLEKRGESANPEELVFELEKRVESKSFKGLDERLEKLNREEKAREKRSREERERLDNEEKVREASRIAREKWMNVVKRIVISFALAGVLVAVGIALYVFVNPEQGARLWSLLQ